MRHKRLVRRAGKILLAEERVFRAGVRPHEKLRAGRFLCMDSSTGEQVLGTPKRTSNLRMQVAQDMA